MKKLLSLFLTGTVALILVAACSVLPALPGLTGSSSTPAESALQPSGQSSVTIPPPPTILPTLTATLTATITPSPTVTPSLTPTPRLFLPAAPGTPVVDMGFSALTLDTLPQVQPVFQAMHAQIRQAVSSRDGKKLFVSTSNGLFVFDQSGNQLAHWLDIFTISQPCQRCLAVNLDGSRFAVATRQAGQWQVQLYAVDGGWAIPKLAFPVQAGFLGAINEAQVAISPDDLYLAYSVGDSELRVFNLQTGLQAFSSPHPLGDLLFTPDGSQFLAREGRNLLFYKTEDWSQSDSLLLPAQDTPLAVSPDGTLLAIAYGTRLRVYQLATLEALREISQPPGGAREWTLTFLNGTTLQGVGVDWNGTHTLATVTIAEWDAQSGQNTRLETLETDSPSPLPPQWNLPLPLADSTNGLEIGELRAFRFISDGMILLNTTHAVCWLKTISAELTCNTDPEHDLFSSDSTAYREIAGERTQLQSWQGETVLDVGAYQIAALDRKGEWVLVDLKGLGTDLYARNKTLPEESVGGAFQNFTEALNWMAFTTQQKSRTFLITIVDKTSGNTLAREPIDFIYPPLLMRKDGTLLVLRRDLDKNQVIFNLMAPPQYTLSEVARLALPAQINQMVTSAREDLLALALADGSVVVTAPDFSASATFQAFDSPVTGLSFSPDGRYLAAVSREGLKIFAAQP